MKLSVEGDGYSYILEHRGSQPDKVPIHQLSAISGGANPDKVFSDKYHVHHKDGNKWLNSVENLEVKSAEEHAREHMESHNRYLDLPMDEVAARYRGGETSTELGDSFDCSPQTIVNKLKKRGVEIRSGGHP